LLAGRTSGGAHVVHHSRKLQLYAAAANPSVQFCRIAINQGVIRNIARDYGAGAYETKRAYVVPQTTVALAPMLAPFLTSVSWY